ELLRLVEEGAGAGRGLRHPGGGAGGDRRVHRGLLQHAAAALVAGVRVPGGLRTNGIKLNPVSTFRGELHQPRRFHLRYYLLSTEYSVLRTELDWCTFVSAEKSALTNVHQSS